MIESLLLEILRTARPWAERAQKATRVAGFAPWVIPRLILILEEMCAEYVSKLEWITKEAFLEFREQIDYEAVIKRKRYLNCIIEKSQ